MGKSFPMVSVLTICLNSERTIRRCIESVLSQDYPHFEYMIQDGGSTDKTLAIIEEYAAQYGEQMRVVSGRDGGADHAYYLGLRRCDGDIIGVCWADEEYLPGAIVWGVENLQRHKEVGAVYGDVYPTDLDGRITKEDVVGKSVAAWDLERYLCGEMVPNYVGSFCWASALRASGFFECYRAGHSCAYDVYAKVGLYYPIRYVPGCVAKYACHSGQLSSTPAVIWRMVETLDSSIEHLMDDPKTPVGLQALRSRARAGVRLSSVNNLLHNAGAVDDAKQMLREALRYQPNASFVETVLRGVLDTLVQTGRYTDALEFLDIACTHGEVRSCAQLWRASVLWHLGRFGEAMQTLREALRWLPKSAQLEGALLGLYNSLVSQSRYAEALDLLGHALESGLVMSDIQLLRANVLCRLGRFRECVEALEMQLATPSKYTSQVETLLQRIHILHGAEK